MKIDNLSLVSVVSTKDFNDHHFRYTHKLLGNLKGEIYEKIRFNKSYFFSQNGFRKLVLSEKCVDELSNYVVPKEIRIDVLKTLPNRKDIIQLDSQNCIKYIKDDNQVTFISCFRKERPDISNVMSNDNMVHTHFFSINLNSGQVFYDHNNTFSGEVFKEQQEVIERYYSKFMVVVTFLELTEINVEIVSGTTTKKRCFSSKIKNNSKFDIVYVTSNWNTYKIKIGEVDVRGHWRLQPYGTGRSKYKYIWIEPFKKGITIRRPQKELV